LAKETFREWWSRNPASRFFLFELKVGKKLFEEWYLPLIVKKLAVKKVVQVEGEEEWKEKKTLFLLPSLFPEAMLFLLWGISEKTAWEIKEKFSVPPFFFFAFLRKVEERKWNDVPWVVIEPDEQALRKIWYSRAQKFDVSLSKAGEKKLFHFLERYDLGMSDVEDFLPTLPDKRSWAAKKWRSSLKEMRKYSFSASWMLWENEIKPGPFTISRCSGVLIFLLPG
jgi:hypothetical protein